MPKCFVRTLQVLQLFFASLQPIDGDKNVLMNVRCTISSWKHWHEMHFVRYVASVVESTEEAVVSGTFLLHQGIQRRLTVTVVHEDGSNLDFHQVYMMTVGNIRSTPDTGKPLDCGESSLVLNPSSVPCPQFPGDSRQDIVLVS